jgi:uncharacterized membrane protein
MAHKVVLKSVTINRPREEVYKFWRDFKNLARFMENIESVSEGRNGLSHWVVKAPAGRTVEWDAAVTDDEPGRRIAWDSAPGADIKHAGFVEFRDAPEGRGSEIHAHIVYDPPGGALGEALAKLFQKEPGVQAHRDLRRLKMLLETGEIARSDAPDAAPRADAGPV